MMSTRLRHSEESLATMTLDRLKRPEEARLLIGGKLTVFPKVDYNSLF